MLFTHLIIEVSIYINGELSRVGWWKFDAYYDPREINGNDYINKTTLGSHPSSDNYIQGEYVYHDVDPPMEELVKIYCKPSCTNKHVKACTKSLEFCKWPFPAHFLYWKILLVFADMSVVGS